ncbi:hypothetical protein Dimus_037872 [Dionaea muscipula]
MVMDAAGLPFDPCYGEYEEEDPNNEFRQFQELFRVANEPLWDGCKHTELSVASRLINLKSEHNMSHPCFDGVTCLMNELTMSDRIPTNYYKAKKVLAGLGLAVQNIDCCIRGCMLYWNDDAELRICKFYIHPRFETRNRGKGKC